MINRNKRLRYRLPQRRNRCFFTAVAWNPLADVLSSSAICILLYVDDDNERRRRLTTTGNSFFNHELK